ncbi:hypothetical protein QFZ24_009802 [Streptomyces phaeochromogenes]|uniref:hypothetical protein n=1 Tax=Streptomyces phaeochromogenes TaxID=1923 RepID=UPI0027932169|nr:hypothetical protein [Streptomyces phaeochromogenes]MDQ0955793.1 hypothetical protein [Streptomyces phaeochromogenes]
MPPVGDIASCPSRIQDLAGLRIHDARRDQCLPHRRRGCFHPRDEVPEQAVQGPVPCVPLAAPPVPRALAAASGDLPAHRDAAGRPTDAVTGAVCLPVAVNRCPRHAEDTLWSCFCACCNLPLTTMRTTQGIFGGRPHEVADRPEPYVENGARHLILRPATDEPRRGQRGTRRRRLSVRRCPLRADLGGAAV